MNYVKAFCVWLGFLAVAVACGMIRDRFLVPGLGPLGGRALGTLLVARDYFRDHLRLYREIKRGDPGFPVKTWLILDDGDNRV